MTTKVTSNMYSSDSDDDEYQHPAEIELVHSRDDEYQHCAEIESVHSRDDESLDKNSEKSHDEVTDSYLKENTEWKNLHSEEDLNKKFKSICSDTSLLGKWKGLHSEEDLNKKIISICSDSIHAAKILQILYPSYNTDEGHCGDHISPDERRHIREQLNEKEEIVRCAKIISKENAELEEEILKKKVELQDHMKKRKALWDKAVACAKLTKNLDDETFSSSELSHNPSLEEEGPKEIETEELNILIDAKWKHIVLLSSVLHRLITFSGVTWAQKKKWLQIVICTGKILNTNFGITSLEIENQEELMNIVDDSIQRLNLVRKM